MKQIGESHWAVYGRNYYTRHDYEDLDSQVAQTLMSALGERINGLAGSVQGRLRVAKADDFSYVDPIDASVSNHQGLRVLFDDGSRIVYRLSGTGTSGATLRVYIERYEADPTCHGLETQHALAELIMLADELAGITRSTGRSRPSVIT